MFQPVIFREYDVRGIYNEQYDDDFAYHLAKSLCSFIYKKTNKKNLRLSIGYDARKSSPALVEKIAAAMKDSGATVYILGLVTSPICYFSTFQLDLDGAIMVTGSHNPPEYNGFKISVGKTTIFGEDLQTLKKIIETNDYIQGSGSVSNYDIFPEYLVRYKKEFGSLKAN